MKINRTGFLNYQNPTGKTEKVNMTKPQNSEEAEGSVINNYLSESRNYADQVRVQRCRANATKYKIKKRKSQYKNLSSKILRSKTSQAAKQVAGQARREVMRLKAQKQNETEENAELDAAIKHAKAMERIAQKKAGNLLQEELAKAAVTSENETAYNDSNQMSEEVSEALADELTEKLTEALSEEMSEEMADMLENIEFSELLSGENLPDREISYDEYREMKIKHRNREMKELVKADNQYLKAIFESYEAAKNAETGRIMSAESTPVSSVEYLG